MIKSIFTYLLVFLAVGFLVYFVHNSQVQDLNFSLSKVYMFFTISSFVICALFQLGSIFKKVKEQLGFIYLAAVVVKLVVFGIVFYDSVFVEPLTMKSRISLLIPLFSLLFFEVFFISKILNQKT